MVVVVDNIVVMLCYFGCCDLVIFVVGVVVVAVTVVVVVVVVVVVYILNIYSYQYYLQPYGHDSRDAFLSDTIWLQSQ